LKGVIFNKPFFSNLVNIASTRILTNLTYFSIPPLIFKLSPPYGNSGLIFKNGLIPTPIRLVVINIPALKDNPIVLEIFESPVPKNNMDPVLLKSVIFTYDNPN